MAEKAEKFVARAPRYKLRPLDNKFLRYAHNDDRGKSFTTQFVDISVSGVAFVTETEFAPHIDQVIKVEIPLNDNDERIAWFAQVVRIETYSSSKWWLQEELYKNKNIVLVALRFKELPEAHRAKIRNAIRAKFLEIQKEKKIRTFVNFCKYARDNVIKVLAYLIAFLASIWILWALSQPASNYDAEKGAPWGQRFPQLNFFDQK